MKKKFVSLAIISLVFIYVLSTGFFILKESITTGISNGQLLANFFAAKATPVSTIPFSHLAIAAPESSLADPQAPIADSALTEIPAITSATTTSGTSTGPTSTVVEFSESSSPISEQALEVLAATLINLQMATGSTSH